MTAIFKQRLIKVTMTAWLIAAASTAERTSVWEFVRPFVPDR